MKTRETITSTGVNDRIKQTLQATNIPIYDWMLDTGLHQADLLLYAALFDEMRHQPLTPMHFNMSVIAKRIHYTKQSMYRSMHTLTENKLIFTQGSGRDMLFSLYPFDTLDLK